MYMYGTHPYCGVHCTCILQWNYILTLYILPFMILIFIVKLVFIKASALICMSHVENLCIRINEMHFMVKMVKYFAILKCDTNTYFHWVKILFFLNQMKFASHINSIFINTYSSWIKVCWFIMLTIIMKLESQQKFLLLQ